MAEPKSGAQAVVGIVVAGALLWYFFGGGLQKQAANDLQDIHKQAAHDLQNIYNQVASDAAQQYEMARRGGTPIEICVQAGLVSAAYLQAKDESNYQRWKQTESTDCADAGVPR